MLDKPHEGVVVELTVRVYGRSAEHLINLIVCESDGEVPLAFTIVHTATFSKQTMSMTTMQMYVRCTLKLHDK